MKEINPKNNSLIVRSVSYALGIMVFLLVLKFAIKLLFGIIPIAIIIFVILKVMKFRK